VRIVKQQLARGFCGATRGRHEGEAHTHTDIFNHHNIC
jgi:hypothetical protein